MNVDGELGAPLQQDAEPQLNAADTFFASQPRRAKLLSTATHSERYVWYVIILLPVVNVFSYMDRMALSVLVPIIIKADLHLSGAQLGLLMGFDSFLFYAICGIPIARWADRGVRKDIIAITLVTAVSGAELLSSACSPQDASYREHPHCFLHISARLWLWPALRRGTQRSVDVFPWHASTAIRAISAGMFLGWPHPLVVLSSFPSLFARPRRMKLESGCVEGGGPVLRNGIGNEVGFCLVP